MNCPLCQSCDSKTFEIEYPFFEHCKFEDVFQRGVIHQCLQCGLPYQNRVIDNDSLKVPFNSLAYLKTQQSSHRVSGGNNNNTKRRRTSIQKEILYPYISDLTNPKVLDIGCNDGNFLLKLSKVLSDGEYWGVDINPGYGELFPKEDNFHFLVSNLPSAHNLSFDLITISHALMFFKNLNSFLCKLGKMLSDKGILFLQSPDIEENPCYLLMGDQYHYYSTDILKYASKKIGYQYEPIHSSWFMRETLGILRRQKKKGIVGEEGFPSIEVSLKKLADLVHRLKKESSGKKVGILGRTANAAFTHSVLKTNVTFFVDEAVHRSEKCTFRNLPVIHPENLSSENTILVPYYSSAVDIVNRLNASFNGKYIAV